MLRQRCDRCLQEVGELLPGHEKGSRVRSLEGLRNARNRPGLCVMRRTSIAGYQVPAGRASHLDACRTGVGTKDLELDAAILLPSRCIVRRIDRTTLAITGAAQAGEVD